TFVFVTHDQEEALDMSDRICVLGDGEIQQLGTPSEIYEEPSNRFVADFIGDTNFLDVEVIAVNGDRATVETPFGLSLTVPHRQAVAGRRAVMSLRPEKINLPALDGQVTLHGTVAGTNYLGGHTYYLLDTGT